MENENTTGQQPLFPEVGSVLRYGWDIMKSTFLPLLLLVIVSALIYFLGSAVFRNTVFGLTFFGGLFGIFVGGPIDYGVKGLFLKAVRHETFELRDLFSVFGPHYLEIVLASFLTSIIVVIGFFLLIIPGIVFACRLAFVPYLVMDKDYKAMDAIHESWEQTRGFAGKIFVLGLVSFFIGLAGFIAFGVGILPAIIWIFASFAAFYHAVDTKSFRVIDV